MKKLFLSLLFISSCATIEVYPVGHFLNLSKNDLIKESQDNYNQSKMDEYVPTELERNDYFSSLQDSITYRNYLLLECALLLNKEHGLDLKKPVYASNPRWNNVQNWYSSIFNFYTLEKDSKETSMECDLSVNKKKEVSEYQLIKSYAKLKKN